MDKSRQQLGHPVPGQVNCGRYGKPSEDGMASLALKSLSLVALTLVAVAACGNSDPANVGNVTLGDSSTLPPDFVERFAVLRDLSWDSIPADWYYQDNSPGAVTVDGRLTWHYPQGDRGGDTPGTRVILEGEPHGPYQYHREEGLLLSSNFHGHASGVNKLRFWTQANGNTSGYLMFEGRGAEELFPAINTQGWPMGLRVIRWSDEDNLASPNASQAAVRRGTSHTLETLVFVGTPGAADGSIRLWLNGVLILHFERLALRSEGQSAEFGGIHYAPVWGGIDDTVPEAMTLSVDRTLVAYGSGVD